MKATVTSIEDTATSNLIRVHHERPDTREGAREGAVEKGFVSHSRFSAHIPAVGDEIELDPAPAATDEPAAESEKEPADAE